MVLGGFYDGTTAAIVIGGTLLATFLRCGWSDSGVTLAMLGHLIAPTRRFAAEMVRARLARVVQDILRHGLLRADPRSTGDGEMDAALHALVGQRSMGAARAVLERAREERLTPSETAIRTLMQAAELAPVFGLAGTLISLSRLPGNGIDRSAYMAAIGMAVHATLYGLVLANLLLAPLARLVERRARREEIARAAIMDWFELELANAFPTRPDGKASEGKTPEGKGGEAKAEARSGLYQHPAQFGRTAAARPLDEETQASIWRAGAP